jgi:hypothetical protein
MAYFWNRYALTVRRHRENPLTSALSQRERENGIQRLEDSSAEVIAKHPKKLS